MTNSSNSSCNLHGWRRTLPFALPLLLAALPGCKGGGGGGGLTVPSPDPTWPTTPATPPPPSTPLGGAPAGTNGIGNVLFSQGIQDPAWTTPLVAGRDATLRVFLAAPSANTLTPTVNVILRDATGTTVLNQNITAPGAGIPVNPLIGNFNDSWNLDIPGALVAPGTTLQASIVANPQSQGLTQLTWPASGLPKPLNVVLAGNQLRLTLVPVTLNNPSGSGTTTGQVLTPTRTLADWVTDIRRFYPLAAAASALDVQVRPQAWAPGLSITLDSNKDINGNAEGRSMLALRNALERERKATPGSAFRFYAGIFPFPSGGTVLGLGEFGLPGQDLNKSYLCLDKVPAGIDPSDTCSITLAHELGHNMGRRHSDCGGAAGVDPIAPANAYLGTWGLDIAAHTVMDPQLNRDFMGYCGPYWISKYNYLALQTAMAQDQAAFNRRASAALTAAVLVTGIVNADGTADLDPLLDVQDTPAQPEPGPYTLTLYDTQGNVIASVPFAMEDPTDGAAPPSFAFEVDLTPDQQAALASATITTPTGDLAARVASRSLNATPREPVAVAWKGGAHLGWDHGIHPEVMVRDLATGDIIATARGGEVDLDTTAGELELIMLDGVRTQVRRVKVTP